MYTQPQLSPLCLQVDHTIVSACYPGSFISSILLVVAEIALVVSWSIYYTHWGSLMTKVQRLNTVFLTKGDPDYHQQKFAQLSRTCSRKSIRQVVNQLRQQCPSHQDLQFCRIHWQLGASSILHKPNDSSVSCSRSFCSSGICPYLFAPNDTSPRIYAPFTIYKKVLYHKKNRQFLRWKFLRSDHRVRTDVPAS